MMGINESLMVAREKKWPLHANVPHFLRSRHFNLRHFIRGKNKNERILANKE